MDWAQYALQVATHAWGEPNGTRRGDEVFWGTQSARKINTQTGTWFDHETAQGGGIADLIRTFAPLANPAEWLRDNCNTLVVMPPETFANFCRWSELAKKYPSIKTLEEEEDL